MEEAKNANNVKREDRVRRQWTRPNLEFISIAQTANDPTSVPSEAGVSDPDLFSSS